MKIRDAERTSSHADHHVGKDFKQFIQQHHPDTHYTFGAGESDESELCKSDSSPGKLEDCIRLKMDSKALFTAMQDQGFFCTRPLDPDKKGLYCKPFPKTQ